jgi:hypothetical protein
LSFTAAILPPDVTVRDQARQRPPGRATPFPQAGALSGTTWE